MEREILRSFDGKNISVAVWQSKANPKGIVQISHGLAEHIARYDKFAKYLAANGFVVVGDDHRGHGETDRDKLGKADGQDIFEDTVKDMLFISETFSRRFELPIVVLGHSYGSFLTRRYMTLQTNPMVRGYILSGTAHLGGFMFSIGRKIAKRKSKKHAGKDADFIIKRTFKKYDKKTKEGKNDWLTRDSKEAGKYNLDPLCGFPISYGFYKSFFDGIATINKSPKPSIANPNIFIASGSKDLFGDSGKLTKKVHESYCDLGLTPELKLYEDARHEILNETNNKEVYSDFLEYIKKCFIEE